MPRYAHNLVGQQFGRLTVLSREQNDRAGKAMWLCQCECGNRKTVAAADLKKKGRGTKSCGCYLVDRVREAQTTHGMSTHPAYAVWRSLLARCRNPRHYAFHNYGARGIDVCPAWCEFHNFWADMGPTYVAGLSLDRIDNDAGYSKENCRWTDRKTQAMNRRYARKIPTPKGWLNVSEASRVFGIGVSTLLYRLNNGWPEASLFVPPAFANRFGEERK